jgi:ribosomal protein L31
MIFLAGNVQDPTCHPAWTGETKVELEDDSHAARFMKKFGMTQEDLQANTSSKKE